MAVETPMGPCPKCKGSGTAPLENAPLAVYRVLESHTQPLSATDITTKVNIKVRAHKATVHSALLKLVGGAIVTKRPADMQSSVVTYQLNREDPQ